MWVVLAAASTVAIWYIILALCAAGSDKQPAMESARCWCGAYKVYFTGVGYRHLLCQVDQRH